MVAITLPDGSARQFDQAVSGAELAADIGPGLAKAALAVRVNGELRDLNLSIEKDAEVAIITSKSEEALELLRHDAAHVMAEAVKELYPDTQVTIGPAIENGFYYDFARKDPFTPEDLEKIEKGISESKQQLGIQDEKTKENVEALVKVYSSMKPEEAANLIEAIDDDLALRIVAGMKSKIAGKVLSKLDVKVAKRISETLAGKKLKSNKMEDNKMMKNEDKK